MKSPDRLFYEAADHHIFMPERNNTRNLQIISEEINGEELIITLNSQHNLNSGNVDELCDYIRSKELKTIIIRNITSNEINIGFKLSRTISNNGVFYNKCINELKIFKT